MKKFSIHSRFNRYLYKWFYQMICYESVDKQLGWQRGLSLVPNSGDGTFLRLN